MDLSVADRRYIAVDFTTDALDALSLDVEFGFSIDGVAPATWYNGSVQEAEGGGYEAIILVGEGTVHEFTAGTPVIVWARVTDNPELPTEPIGVILPY